MIFSLDKNCNVSSIGDGSCDVANNNAMCMYDDGDCCGVGNNTDLCSNCSCNTTGKCLVFLKFQINIRLVKMVLAMSTFYLGN